MLLFRAKRLATSALLVASATQAQTPPPSSSLGAALDPSVPGVHIVDDSEPLAPLVPSAKDLLGGHVLVGAAVGANWSLGSLGSQVTSASGLGTGLALQGDLALGVSRAISLGVWGELGRYGDGSACSGCAGSAFGVGPFVRYHLTQGLRFDPWVLAGAGFRSVSFEDSVGAKQTFSGPQWLRLELGADFYAWSGVGLGPYASLSLSSYGRRPENTGDTTVNTELSAGLRFLFDLPGR